MLKWDKNDCSQFFGATPQMFESGVHLFRREKDGLRLDVIFYSHDLLVEPTGDMTSRTA